MVGGLRGVPKADMAGGNGFVECGQGVVDMLQQCRQVPCRARRRSRQRAWCDAGEAAEGVADRASQERGAGGGRCHGRGSAQRGAGGVAAAGG
jgi:hypothetical protein